MYSRPFAGPGHMIYPPLNFNTWHFVNTRNGKSKMMSNDCHPVTFSVQESYQDVG